MIIVNLFKIFDLYKYIIGMALTTNKMMLVAVNMLMKLFVAAIIRSIADMSKSVYISCPFTKNYITY